MSRLEDRTINQILLQVIGPMLIACMVGSLVFFFIEVLYRGPHTARLYWVMGLFTIAAVLVSRISIDEGRERAQLFGLALGVATLMASLRLVEFSYAGLTVIGPLVVLALIAMVMWSSAKLTWDCTVVDRSRDASAMGLLEIVKRKLSRRTTTVSSTDANGEPSVDGCSPRFSFLLGKSKKNSPGIWVFYFAIFAFPVFGIGQWFVQQESKSWIYVLFAVYLGSTLGLLMTTSLLGLERYLSQRNLHVPAAVGRNWLIVGSLFALLVVLAVMLLPRTGSDSFSHLLTMFTSPQRNSSKLAIGKDGQQHLQDANNKRVDPDGEKPGDGGDQVDAQPGEPANGNSQNGESNRQGDSSNASKQNHQESDSRQSDQHESKSELDANSSEPIQQTDRNTDQQNDPAHRDPDRVRNQKPERNDENARQQGGQQNERIAQQQAEPRPDRQQPPAKSKPSGELWNRMLETISSGLRSVSWLVGIGALLLLAWMFRNELAKLFGSFSRRKPRVEPTAEIPAAVSVRLPPFASFRDPFANGKAESMSANQLANYTMAALEAWGRDFDIQRDLETTPHEYARCLAAIDSHLSMSAIEFAELYGRCAFSSETVSRIELKPLVNLWRRMAHPVAKPPIRPSAAANP